MKFGLVSYKYTMDQWHLFLTENLMLLFTLCSFIQQHTNHCSPPQPDFCKRLSSNVQKQQFSKCVPWVRSIQITWELTRNVNYFAQPRPELKTVRVGPSDLFLHVPLAPAVSDTLKFENHCPRHPLLNIAYWIKRLC